MVFFKVVFPVFLVLLSAGLSAFGETAEHGDQALTVWALEKLAVSAESKGSFEEGLSFRVRAAKLALASEHQESDKIVGQAWSAAAVLGDLDAVRDVLSSMGSESRHHRSVHVAAQAFARDHKPEEAAALLIEMPVPATNAMQDELIEWAKSYDALLSAQIKTGKLDAARQTLDRIFQVLDESRLTDLNHLVVVGIYRMKAELEYQLGRDEHCLQSLIEGIDYIKAHDMALKQADRAVIEADMMVNMAILETRGYGNPEVGEAIAVEALSVLSRPENQSSEFAEALTIRCREVLEKISNTEE